jgi:hypothetical protein
MKLGSSCRFAVMRNQLLVQRVAPPRPSSVALSSTAIRASGPTSSAYATAAASPAAPQPITRRSCSIGVSGRSDLEFDLVAGIDPDALQLSVRIERRRAHLAPDAALAEATEG